MLVCVFLKFFLCVEVLINDIWIVCDVQFFSQVEAAPVAAKTEEPKSKSDCYGVFCLTYDLKAVSSSILMEDLFRLLKMYNSTLFQWLIVS